MDIALTVAFIQPKCELIALFLAMLPASVMINAIVPTFQDSSYRLNPVSMGHAAGELFNFTKFSLRLIVLYSRSE